MRKYCSSSLTVAKLAGLRGPHDVVAVVGGTGVGFAVRALAIAARLSLPSHAGLGHKDGGALAMRVYGHLRDQHSVVMAQRVTFTRPATSNVVRMPSEGAV